MENSCGGVSNDSGQTERGVLIRGPEGNLYYIRYEELQGYQITEDPNNPENTVGEVRAIMSAYTAKSSNMLTVVGGFVPVGKQPCCAHRLDNLRNELSKGEAS